MDDMKDMLEGPCGATVPTKWYIAFFKVVEGFTRTRAKAESELYPGKDAGEREKGNEMKHDYGMPPEWLPLLVSSIAVIVSIAALVVRILYL